MARLDLGASNTTQINKCFKGKRVHYFAFSHYHVNKTAVTIGGSFVARPEDTGKLIGMLKLNFDQALT